MKLLNCIVLGAAISSGHLAFSNCFVDQVGSLWESHPWYGSMLASFPDRTARIVSSGRQFGTFCGSVAQESTLQNSFSVAASNYYKISLFSDGPYELSIQNNEVQAGKSFAVDNQMLSSIVYLQQGTYDLTIDSKINLGASGIAYSIQSTSGEVVVNSQYP